MKLGWILIALAMSGALVVSLIGDATPQDRELQAFTVGAQLTCLLVGAVLTWRHRDD